MADEGLPITLIKMIWLDKAVNHVGVPVLFAVYVLAWVDEGGPPAGSRRLGDRVFYRVQKTPRKDVDNYVKRLRDAKMIVRTPNGIKLGVEFQD